MAPRWLLAGAFACMGLLGPGIWSASASSGAGRIELAFLSPPRDGQQPSQQPLEAPPPQADKTAFDGRWVFTSAGCRYTGPLPATIIGGKILARGGSGQVEPDGTLHSVGAGGGMTMTAEGRLYGDMGSGTFDRSDGCSGTWIAIRKR